MNNRIFQGKWISDGVMAVTEPRNVFHRQLDKIKLPEDPNQNRHILFRKKFDLESLPKDARIYISADDYYKLYINGDRWVRVPAPQNAH